MKNIFIILFFVSFLLSDHEEKILYSVKYNGIKAGEATLEKKIFNDNINIIFNLKSRKFRKGLPDKVTTKKHLKD